MIAELEPILLAFNVSVAIWGHNHAVQVDFGSICCPWLRDNMAIIDQRQCACANGDCVQHSSERVINGQVVHVHENPPVPVRSLTSSKFS
jgi:hypothetical protein